MQSQGEKAGIGQDLGGDLLVRPLELENSFPPFVEHDEAGPADTCEKESKCWENVPRHEGKLSEGKLSEGVSKQGRRGRDRGDIDGQQDGLPGCAGQRLGERGGSCRGGQRFFHFGRSFSSNRVISSGFIGKRGRITGCSACPDRWLR